MTFDPHPRKVLLNDQGLKLIHTINEKINILESLGLDHLVIYPFTLEFSKFSAKRYIDELLVKKLDTHTLVIGYDHHFGNDREGNIDLLKKHKKSNPFYLEEIKAHEIEEIKLAQQKLEMQLKMGTYIWLMIIVDIFTNFMAKLYMEMGLVKQLVLQLRILS